MRNRALHAALRNFALEVAEELTSALRAGAELAMELEEEPGAGPTLYHYRPLTADFIAERWPRLRALPACSRAADALGEGAWAYLRTQGVGGAEAEPALQAMLERLYDDATGFEFPEERFERVYAEVERTLYETAVHAVVLAPVTGLRLEGERVELGHGLALVSGEKAEAPPEAIWPHRAGHDQRSAEPNVLAILERDLPADCPLPAAEARVRFRRLLTALRLWRPGPLALAAVGWTRADEGRWRSVPMPPGGPGRGEVVVLPRAGERELAELLRTVEHARPGGAVDWALARFEMGCERSTDAEALSDHLLALRGLIEGREGPGPAGLSLRVAALCAEEPDRRATQRRMESALALERFVMSGRRDRAYREAVGSEPPDVLVLEVERHLRALLRDVLSGHLDPNLAATADEILLIRGEPVEIGARDLRGERVGDDSEGQAPTGRAPVDEAVTASVDWDEDGAGYSAPV